MKKKLQPLVTPYRVDVVVTHTDGSKSIRHGCTPYEVEMVAEAMWRHSNSHPMVFGPRSVR